MPACLREMVAKAAKSIRWHMKHAGLTRDEAMRNYFATSVMGPALRADVLQAFTMDTE
jgi:hypothetical protein